MNENPQNKLSGKRKKEKNKIAELAIYWYRPGCQNIANLLKMKRGTRLWTMMGRRRGKRGKISLLIAQQRGTFTASTLKNENEAPPPPETTKKGEHCVMCVLMGLNILFKMGTFEKFKPPHLDDLISQRNCYCSVLIKQLGVVFPSL